MTKNNQFLIFLVLFHDSNFALSFQLHNIKFISSTLQKRFFFSYLCCRFSEEDKADHHVTSQNILDEIQVYIYVYILGLFKHFHRQRF